MLVINCSLAFAVVHTPVITSPGTTIDVSDKTLNNVKQICVNPQVVTKESFISICWRLIPYWLNNWEQQWGAESSSMMFELPHFAVELLVILPCVQILCSRLKILALPHVSDTYT